MADIVGINSHCTSWRVTQKTHACACCLARGAVAEISLALPTVAGILQPPLDPCVRLGGPPLPLLGLTLSCIIQCQQALSCTVATASSGSISSSQARYGILGLPRSFSTLTTASMKHSSNKKSKKGRAGRESSLKGPKRAAQDAESAGGSISADWTLGSAPSQGRFAQTTDETLHIVHACMCFLML